MNRKWFKRLRFLLLLLVLIFCSTSTYGGFFDFYPNGSILFISSFQVNLGLPISNPSPPNGRKEYFEKENALYVSFWAQVPEWQIFLTGEDFVSGNNSIPIKQLEWRRGNGNYKKMPRNGRPVCVTESNDYKGSEMRFHIFGLSYKLELIGDEMAGIYRAPMTISMIFP